jgi:hypothetical protein
MSLIGTPQVPAPPVYIGFSNRPFGVKRFQTIHHYSVDVAHGLLLLGNACGQEMPIMSLISIV